MNTETMNNTVTETTLETGNPFFAMIDIQLDTLTVAFDGLMTIIPLFT